MAQGYGPRQQTVRTKDVITETLTVNTVDLTTEVGLLASVTAQPVDLNQLFGTSPVYSAERTFTETTGAGTYSASVTLPAGATLIDVIVTNVALWTATTSATLDVGDTTDPNGFFAAFDLKATDLLAGESVSFAHAGGKAGAYITATHANGRYSAAARNIVASVVTVGAAGDAGRTRVTVVYSAPQAANIVAATKA